MKFPHIIALSPRHGIRLAAIALLFWLPACGKSPTAPPPGPQPLSMVCPARVTASAPAGQSVVLTFSPPTTTGGTAPIAVTCTPGSGALFATGSTPVSCTATDSAGRSAACGFVVDVTAIPVIARTRFMAFGDSLTEGKVSRTSQVLVDAGPHSYPARLRDLLTARYSTQPITVVNEGWGGERADASFPRFRGAMSQHQPEVVLLMHGVNDLISGSAGSVQSAADGVEELIKEARNVGAMVFVATLPPLGPGPKASCTSECVDPYNDRIRALAAAKGATLVDVHAAWGNQGGLMGADGIHPTEAGYELIATAFFDAIRRTLESPPGALR